VPSPVISSLPVDTVEAPFSLPHSSQHPSSVLALRANPPSPTRGEGRGALFRCHARFSPSGLCQRTPPLQGDSREAGRLAEPSETKIPGATSAPRRRFLSPPVPLRVTGCDSAPPFGFATISAMALATAFADPACVLLQHAGTVVSRGEPLGGASPAPWLRRPWSGGADPSPLSNDSGAFPAGRTLRLCGRGRMCEQIRARRFSKNPTSH
jgi:hypothetical protein